LQGTKREPKVNQKETKSVQNTSLRVETQEQPRGSKRATPKRFSGRALFRAAFRFAVRILFLVFLLIDSAL